jgi:hypothetical protein
MCERFWTLPVVVDIVRELQGFGIPVQAHDPVATPKDAQSEYGISLVSRDALQPAHAVILAVPHCCFIDEGWSPVTSLLKNAKGAGLDLKASFRVDTVPPASIYGDFEVLCSHFVRPAITCLGSSHCPVL